MNILEYNWGQVEVKYEDLPYKDVEKARRVLYCTLCEQAENKIREEELRYCLLYIRTLIKSFDENTTDSIEIQYKLIKDYIQRWEAESVVERIKEFAEKYREFVNLIDLDNVTLLKWKKKNRVE